MIAQKTFNISPGSVEGETLIDKRSQAVSKITSQLGDLHAIAHDNDFGMLGYLIEMAMLEAASQVKKITTETSD